MFQSAQQNQRRILSPAGRIAAWTLVLAGAVLGTHALAQGEAETPPARIRMVQGTVTVEGVHERERFPATSNLSLFSGDGVETGSGRAELSLPDGSLIWLADQSQVNLVRLGSPEEAVGEGTALSLRAGTVTIEYAVTSEASEANLRVDTPEASVYLLGSGRFRIDSQGGTTSVTAWSGVAELAGDQGSNLIWGGQRSEVEYAAAPAQAWEVNVLRLDEFDEWCEGRADRYVREVGTSDEEEYREELPAPVRSYAAELEYYGDWRFLVDFGWVWRPHAYGVGWRPYYEGYWRWSPYGWTWVASEPWGWAPYHYGRWHRATSVGWVWIPGAVYSGAWVSWAVTPTYIGWCPLDYYNRPAYVHISASSGRVRHYGGAWNFLPLDRFDHRRVRRQIVQAHHVPDLDGAVVSRDLPRFRPRTVERNPETGRQLYREVEKRSNRLDSPRGADRQGLGSFRDQDRREKTARGRSLGRGRSPSGSGQRIDLTSPQDVGSSRMRGEVKTPATGNSSRGTARQPMPSGRSSHQGGGPLNRREGIPGKSTVDRRSAPEPGKPTPEGKVSPPRATRPRGQSPSKIAPETQDPSKRVLRRIFPDRERSAPRVRGKGSPGRGKTAVRNREKGSQVTRPKRGGTKQKVSPNQGSGRSSSRSKPSRPPKSQSGKKDKGRGNR